MRTSPLSPPLQYASLLTRLSRWARWVHWPVLSQGQEGRQGQGQKRQVGQVSRQGHVRQEGRQGRPQVLRQLQGYRATDASGLMGGKTGMDWFFATLQCCNIAALFFVSTGVLECWKTCWTGKLNASRPAVQWQCTGRHCGQLWAVSSTARKPTYRNLLLAYLPTLVIWSSHRPIDTPMPLCQSLLSRDRAGHPVSRG